MPPVPAEQIGLHFREGEGVPYVRTYLHALPPGR